MEIEKIVGHYGCTKKEKVKLHNMCTRVRNTHTFTYEYICVYVNISIPIFSYFLFLYYLNLCNFNNTFSLHYYTKIAPNIFALSFFKRTPNACWPSANAREATWTHVSTYIHATMDVCECARIYAFHCSCIPPTIEALQSHWRCNLIARMRSRVCSEL